MFRQGDVLISKCQIPSDAVEQHSVDRIVLAEGEATGHAHVVSAAHAAAYLVGAVMYLRVLQETMLRHEEHTHIRLPIGDYLVTRQREYTPEGIRNVAD